MFRMLTVWVVVVDRQTPLWVDTSLFGTLEEARECFEKSENLRFRQNVWENAEVNAKARKAFEAHLQVRVSIIGKEREHGFVDDRQHVDNVFVLQNWEQLLNLTRSIRGLTSFRTLNLSVQFVEAVRKHRLNRAHWVFSHCKTFFANEEKSFEEFVEIKVLNFGAFFLLTPLLFN